MKKYIFVCLVFISCQTSLTNKFESKIKDQFKNDHVEHLKIDSLHYFLGDATEFSNYLLEDNTDYRSSLIALYNSYRADDNSKATSVMHEIINNDKETDLIKKLPEIIKDSIYNVDYYINYQTDKNNYSGRQKKFYFKKDLSPVTVDIDSIKKSINRNFDSISILHALNLNDSLVILKDSLQNKLRNKIALGTTEMEKLIEAERIDKIDVLITANKEKYPFLFFPL